MKQTIKKTILSIATFSFIAIVAIGLIDVNNVSALVSGDLWGNATIANNVGTEIGLPEKDPREIIGAVIRIVLGFLGIIAVLIILAGGFKYMTAGGSEDKTDEAKKLMVAGAIGLVIILASFGIATFIMNALIGAVT